MMNKKVIFTLFFLIFSLPLFADIGLGLEGGYSPFGNDSAWRAGATLRISEYPFVFSATGYGDRSEWSAALSAGYWMVNPKLFSMLHYYMGPGLTFATSFDREEGLSHLFFGTSFFGGVNLFVFDFLETYLQAGFEFGVNFAGDDGLKFPKVHLPLTGGFRFWF